MPFDVTNKIFFTLSPASVFRHRHSGIGIPASVPLVTD
jgi:hypothetical protein